MDIRQFMKRKKHFWYTKCRKHFRQKIEK